ncbi:MAG TPA: MarR family winged helix-turn-helix transcriptional regulator [Nitrososphaeraceae archaeon]|nr:MarR family winged helix-turn-helix transcriptional regulator [Nitrososphaeraceae archaeon]
MSDKVDIGHSPNHFIVLDAISRGINNIDKISRVSKLSKAEVEQIVNDLVFQRLVIRNEKRGFLGRKKIELKITETGSSLLDNKKKELQENVQKMQQYYNSGDKSQLDSFMVSNRAWMPMMLFTGLMDILFFTSMMSLLGLALNPMESSFSDAGANVDNSGNAQDTTSSTDTTDSSGAGADSQDTGNDGGGFDGGGFDGFDGGGFGF